jgi:hypothetical protein
MGSSKARDSGLTPIAVEPNMFFRKKQNADLETAIEMLDRATEIVYNFKWNKDYVPTPDDLKKLARFEQALRESKALTQYVVRTMHQRFLGEFGTEEEWQELEALGFDRKSTYEAKKGGPLFKKDTANAG